MFYLSGVHTNAQNINVGEKLKDFDKTVEKILRDWNVPGCGIGIVVKRAETLVFARGYGYRYFRKEIACNCQHFISNCFEHKTFSQLLPLDFWWKTGNWIGISQLKNYVPQIQFYNDELNTNVTIRDMLSHRTGISRHDNIWYKSDFTRQE